MSVSGESYLISKNSMVGTDPKVRVGNDNLVPARIVNRDVERDLILLEIAGQLAGIELYNIDNDTLTSDDLGVLLISPQPNGSGKLSVIGSTDSILKRLIKQVSLARPEYGEV